MHAGKATFVPTCNVTSIVENLSILGFLAVAILPFLVTAKLSKQVNTERTGKPCGFCHTEYGSKELIEAGKYYTNNGTSEGYKPSK